MIECVICGVWFSRPRGSKRRTCSFSCRVSLGWRSMSDEGRAQRLGRMSAVATANQVGTKLNAMRWARSGERERTAQQNRERWADPEYNTRVAAAISKAHAKPEVQARLSAAAIRRWQNPRYRERTLPAMLAAHQAQRHRDLMSAIRTAQWRDPVYRARGLAAIMRRRDAQRAMMLNRWEIKRALARPPVVVKPPVRPAMPEPTRGFSMLGGRIARREQPAWRRLDLTP